MELNFMYLVFVYIGFCLGKFYCKRKYELSFVDLFDELVE